MDCDLPIIGIQKSYAGGQLRITPDIASATALAKAGANIIALDCTDRPHLIGEPWREIVRRIHEELGLLVMADIATLREGIAAAEAGVDLVGTTLHGYTDETRKSSEFNPRLVAELQCETHLPIVAEGHIAVPAMAREALVAGAWCVVVGSAITRPGTITAGFVRAMQFPALSAEEPASRSKYAAAFDIGGTYIKAAIVSDSGEILMPHQVPTHVGAGRNGISQSLATALERTLRCANDAGLTLAGVGVASAGAIDADRGVVFAATENLPGWAGFDIRTFLQAYTALPVFVENDAHAAALAELQFGAGRGFDSFVALTVGTGIGGGIVVGRRLLRGQYGFAGTVGHQSIRFDGRLCNCGRLGCLEAYVSTAALIEEFLSLSPDYSDYPDDPIEGTAGEVARRISDLAAAGDSSACKAYSVLAGYLAEGVANLFNILDPQAVILSGGLVEGYRSFAEQVQINVERLLHFGSKRSPRILSAEAGVHAGVQGAGATVFDRQN
jgi:glucokinase-like ROK family protein